MIRSLVLLDVLHQPAFRADVRDAVRVHERAMAFLALLVRRR